MLTNAAAKAAGATDRAYKLTDQGGLHLLVRPTGTKSWQQKYRWAGREKLLTLGQFPEVNVNRARMLQAEAKEQLANGVDPARAGGSIDTLETLARAWHASRGPAWSKAHAGDVLASLERDLFPDFGTIDPRRVTAPQLLTALRAIEKRGCAATAHRVRQRLCEIFAFARAQGLVETNPAEDLGAAMLAAPPSQPHPALTTVDECRQLFDELVHLNARAETVAAARFLALTAVRLEAVRGMRWSEVDFGTLTWTVPAARMKLSRAKKGDERFDHVVPLSEAALALLDTLRKSTSNEAENLNAIVFPGRSGAQIGAGVLRELHGRTAFAGRHVPHGWRASFSTILNEDLGREWNTDIEEALGHIVKGKVEGAYNRSTMLDRRRALFDRWGELVTGTL
ncbi:MAG: integrase arm-type DNA-binding domain-containing protein [Pseudomonadota bacterium]